MKHNIAWFDIPVVHLDRAIRFYAAVLGAPVKKEQTGSVPLGIASDTRWTTDGLLPGSERYLQAFRRRRYDLVWRQWPAQRAVAAVRANGGTVQRDVHAIGSYGFRAEVLDSEGNCIALYSEPDQ